MRRHLFILTIIFIIMLFSASAEFDLSTTTIKKNIFLSESAVFNVSIENYESISDVYLLSTLDTSWTILTPQVEVSPSESKSFELIINPTTDVHLGIHAINMKFKSLRTGIIKNEVLVINVRPFDPIFGEYRPSIQLNVDFPAEFFPTEKARMQLFLKNENALDVGTVLVKINGELFEEETTISLGPLDQKREEFIYEFDPLQEPGTYPLKVEILVKNISISQSNKLYEIKGYSDVKWSRVEESFLFKKTVTYTLENDGNMKKIMDLKVNTSSFFPSIFENSDPSYEKIIKEDGKKKLFLNSIELEPQELQTITITTNYRVPVIIIILIIIAIIAYFYLRSPVLVGKEALPVGSINEGFQHLKIRIFVKNRSRSKLENVSVVDRIPGIAELIKKKTLGTLEPDKVTRQEKKGTMIKWTLEGLEPFEERIITYEIQSKLKIIGNVSLPSTKTKFTHRNKEKSVYSNKLMVRN